MFGSLKNHEKQVFSVLGGGGTKITAYTPTLYERLTEIQK